MIFTKDDYKVTMTVNESLTANMGIKVFYRKPGNQAAVEKTPTIIDLENNKVIYHVPAADNNVCGKWSFWCRVINSDNKVATSTPVIIDVHLAGN